MLTLSKEIRDALTPKKAVEMLKEGNSRFVNNLKINRNLLKQVNETSEKQHPFAFVLSCIDSRTSAELIFDQGLGDILSCRIAGNILNDDIIGSMEFGCKISGVKLIMVLGHTECGAIKGACDNLKMGKLTNLLKKIQPAISAEKNIIENRNSYNIEFTNKVTSINVKNTMAEIVKKSRIIKTMIKKNQIILIGGIYNVSSGLVEFYN
jgi:carbonic anhydrase